MQDFLFKMVDDGTYCVVQYEGDEAEVTIPEQYCGKPVTILNDNLFAGHQEITAVHIPDSVTQIGGFVFDGCVGLKRIELPAGLTDMWGYAFVRSGLEEVVLPEHVKSIVSFVFKDCKNLKRVVCNAGLKKIYAWAFQGCDRLTEFEHSPDVEISPKAFEDQKQSGR